MSWVCALAGRRSGVALLCLSSALLLTFASSASALTLGVGWSGNPGNSESEMPLVAKSGAAVFRQTFAPTTNNDGLVTMAAESGVTIHPVVQAEYAGDPGLPSGANRTDFLNKLSATVKRYGYNGEFWSEASHSGLPKKYITTWEVWNEPNLHGIAAGEFGQFVSEAANTIQSASQAAAGRNTDVISGGLLVWGNIGAGEAGYTGAQKYLEQAYANFGANANVTGVAIHPYELDPETFYKPLNLPRYNRIEAFKYAVAGLSAKVGQLAGGGAQKSIWITESGWPAEHQYGVGEAEQASLLSQSIQYVKSNEASLRAKDYLWYNFRDIPGTEGDAAWDNWCGLRAHDGHFRQAWTAFQQQANVAQGIPQAPGVETQGTSRLLSNQAQVMGSVNPQSFATSYHFDYGTSTSYGASVAFGNAGSGSASVAVSAQIAQLKPNTVYHYRLVASNLVGTSFGVDRQFTTPREIIQPEDDDFGGPHPVVKSNGIIDTFYRTASGTLGTDYYHPGEGWTGATLGGSIAAGAAPHPIVHESGTLDVFWRTSEAGLGHAFYTPATGWGVESLGGSVAGEPHAVIDFSETMNVFWRTPAGGLGHAFYIPGSGKGWQFESLPGSVAGDVYAVVDFSGTINAFWRTPSGELGHIYNIPGSGKGWQLENLPGSVSGDPHPVVDSSGTVNVFWRTATGGLGHIFYIPGSGKGWQTQSLTGSVAGEPRPVVQPVGGTMDVFYRTGTGKVGHTWYTGATGWTSETLAGELTGEPFPVVQEGGTMDVFSRTPSGQVGHNWYTGPTGWGRDILPGSVDGSSSMGIHSVAQPAGTIDVFFRTPTGTFGHDWYASSSWFGQETLPGSL
jgi:hypothetical protein